MGERAFSQDVGLGWEAIGGNRGRWNVTGVVRTC